MFKNRKKIKELESQVKFWQEKAIEYEQLWCMACNVLNVHWNISGGRFRDALAERTLENKEKVKSLYREYHTGECRMFSKGEKCNCFLCEIDNWQYSE